MADFQNLEGNFHSPPPLQATAFVLLAKFPSAPYDTDAEVLSS